ncbi:RTA1 like protein-domain-containing protein [Apiospora arundinis]|uniref:RTA1 like protein-domain-containing protein n=1 Tax=Apiospora arundinis TaxID=335852 RepID=A0ABR2J5B0_9PEZI
MPSQSMSQAVSALFLIVFVSSLLGCVAFTVLLRRWPQFTYPLALACVFEIIGYGIRCVIATRDDWSAQLFVVITIFLTIAPSFVSMAMYTTIERTLLILGKEHSLIRPKWYFYLVWADLAGLVIQIVGLGLALSGIKSKEVMGPLANSGGVVVAMGIGLHAATLAVFMVLFAIALCQAYVTYRQYGSTTADVDLGVVGLNSGKALTRRFKGYLLIVALAVVCLLVRDLYRTIGLAQGFTTANVSVADFALLDGFLVAEAVLGLVAFHPAWVLTEGYKPEPDQPLQQQQQQQHQQGKEIIGLGGYHTDHTDQSSNFI